MKEEHNAQEVERLRLRCICNDDDCWIWAGATSHGLPSVKRFKDGEGATVSARRVMYEASRGRALRPSDRVSTRCGNVACLNPEHLKRNSFTDVAKKVAATPAGRAMRVLAGRRSRADSRSKLDMDKARYIRASDKPSRELAQELGVSRTLIDYVRKGDRWREDGANPFAGLFAMNDSTNRKAA
jgi:hypothetical protein